MPILLLSLVGSGVFLALFISVRRFDAERGTDGDGDGGGGGNGGTGPDRPSSPLVVVDPQLGEIRASRRPISEEIESSLPGS